MCALAAISLREGIITARTDLWGRIWDHRREGVAGHEAADLSARLRAGDPAALGEMAEVWGPRLYRYLLRFAEDPETARDLAQEALLRAVKALLAGTLPTELSPWLFRIATNLARDHHRSAYRRRVTLGGEIGGWTEQAGENPEGIAMARSLAASRSADVGRALRALPPELREVVVLRFCEDQPVKAIAGILGIPEGTVKSRLYRAYRTLERSLEAWRPRREEEGSADG